ncbi:hypothetical protein [Aeromonas media]|uniref:Uncharacterized protein n=1 Tax=Aeromonas media TaxID=651 RepID=A0AAE7AL45_AERME|nr:hypothetical protein [Aeromonas media]MBS4640634.1 hypothetical protein [Aeromonas media]QJT31038.1 hypothetical protein E4186_13225 [Aeromonas media]
MVVCPFYYSGINFLSLLDKVKLAAMTLLIALTLLLSTVSVEGLKAPASQHAAQLMGEAADSTDGARIQHGASDSDDGVVKFVGSHQNHLLRLEHSLSRDHQPGRVVYELVMSWAQQGILLLCGLLLYAALCYPRTSFRDHFASIHRHRLQRRHLQYRFSQSFLA